MRASEIIRSVLDLIDEIEQSDAETESAEQFYSDEKRRFDQVSDLLSPEITFGPANAPNEQYAEIEAVTTAAGGGVNGPKHLADIRADSVAMYPGANHVR
jgi:hypothetical protein